MALGIAINTQIKVFTDLFFLGLALELILQVLALAIS